MRPLRRVFEIDYAHANAHRKHRHRCLSCSRVLQDGERGLMYRRARGDSFVVHVPVCAEAATDGMTWRERFAAWEAEAGLAR